MEYFTIDPGVVAKLYADQSPRSLNYFDFEFFSLDFCSRDELSLVAMFRWNALDQAIKDVADAEVIAILEREWLEVFGHLCHIDPGYKQRYLDRKITMPMPYTKENLAKHTAAMEGSES